MNDIIGNDYRLLYGDCLDRLSTDCLSSSVDMILTDLPYGSTKCAWDVIVPIDDMWEVFIECTHKNSSILLFGVDPFKSLLVFSNIKMYRYTWYWDKKKAANFMFGNNQPLRKVEPISVFYQQQPTYNPLKMTNPNGVQNPDRKGFGNTIHDHFDHLPKRKVRGVKYEPDKLLPDDIIDEKDLEGFIISCTKPQKPLHPTQKPVSLLRYLIETYTESGDLVLDATMGSGSTGVACLLSKRRFLGVENNTDYFLMAMERMKLVSEGNLSLETQFSKDLLSE